MSKTWVRKEKIADVGKCRYCKEDMISTFDSLFVAFANHTKAHYLCMKKADEDKTFENESKFDW
jgi:hypothetical protein